MLRWKPMLLTLSFAVLSALCASPGAHAEDAPPAKPDEEYDFSWLDPEKKIYVVQNRKYDKKGKAELSIAGGIGIGEPYRTSRIILPRLSYYFNEHWGLSFLAGFNSNSENQNFLDLKQATSTIPTVRDVQQFYGGSVHWIPFYGKINMFNTIFYIDWQFELGISQISSEIDLNTRNTGTPNVVESSHMGFHWGTGHKFFITRNWAARLDFLAQYYKAPAGRGGVITGEEVSFDNYYLTLGASYTF